LPSAKETLGKEASLLSVKKTLDKDLLCRVFFFILGKEASLPSVFLPSVFLALGKELLCRVVKKYSANHLTLGKEPDSDSVLPHALKEELALPAGALVMSDDID